MGENKKKSYIKRISIEEIKTFDVVFFGPFRRRCVEKENAPNTDLHCYENQIVDSSTIVHYERCDFSNNGPINEDSEGYIELQLSNHENRMEPATNTDLHMTPVNTKESYTELQLPKHVNKMEPGTYTDLHMTAVNTKDTCTYTDLEFPVYLNTNRRKIGSEQQNTTVGNGGVYEEVPTPLSQS